MNHPHMTFERVSKEYVVHVIGEDEHNYILQKVLSTKQSTFREFVDSLGAKKFLHFVPMSDDVSYFMDDGKK
jgi:hypothetical protein